MICFLKIEILGRFWPEVDQQWRSVKLFHIEGHLLRCPSCKCHKRWSQRPSFFTSAEKISQKDIERSILGVDYSVSRISRVPHFLELSFTYLRLGAICYLPKKRVQILHWGGKASSRYEWTRNKKICKIELSSWHLWCYHGHRGMKGKRKYDEAHLPISFATYGRYPPICPSHAADIMSGCQKCIFENENCTVELMY